MLFKFVLVVKALRRKSDRGLGCVRLPAPPDEIEGALGQILRHGYGKMRKVEIEKKFQLTPEQRQQLESLLPAAGAASRGESFEENILFGGDGLDNRQRLLRLRRSGGKALLTYKERLDSDPTIRRRREEETYVADPEAIVNIFGLTNGYKPAIIYEKRRTTWELAGTEITVDELPFGTFLEIEGDEEAIMQVEHLLGRLGLVAEPLSYPDLIEKHGVMRQGILESRFKA